MGVTNGMLRLDPAEFAQLRGDAAAFERRAHDYGHEDYLDLDKAGYELLFMVDPPTLDGDDGEPSPWPHLAALLGGGEVVHPDLDLGYGPARLVANADLRGAAAEIAKMTLDDLVARAEDDLVSDLLLGGSDEETLRDYHWPHLQALREFVETAVRQGRVVLRY